MTNEEFDKSERQFKNFSSPMELAKSTQLSLEHKVELLKRWEEDARRVSVASEEGMVGGTATTLEQVVEAQCSLDIAPAAERPPTKG